MPYTNNPANNPVDQLRLLVGDAFSDMEVLSDQAYQFYLTKYNGNVNRASKDVVRALINALCRFVRERTGDVEAYGSEWAKNYIKALTEFLNNPNIALDMSSAMPYAGGISRKDMMENDNTWDNIRPDAYIGRTEGIHQYDQYKQTGGAFDEFDFRRF